MCSYFAIFLLFSGHKFKEKFLSALLLQRNSLRKIILFCSVFFQFSRKNNSRRKCRMEKVGKTHEKKNKQMRIFVDENGSSSTWIHPFRKLWGRNAIEKCTTSAIHLFFSPQMCTFFANFCFWHLFSFSFGSWFIITLNCYCLCLMLNNDNGEKNQE